MRLDRKLNFVIPIEREDGDLYAHVTPISREVFERYFLVISKTFSAIYGEGLGWQTGPRVAMMMMRRIATEMDAWDGPTGVEAGLVAEFRRLTMILYPGEAGWTQVPLQTALTLDLLSEDELSEVENALAFFMVVSVMHKRNEVGVILGGAGRVWDASTTSSNSTEYMSSLKTSTPAASTGETGGLSSMPS